MLGLQHGHRASVRRSSVAERPTGDIVPAALPAFALEASDTALDAKSTFEPERLVVFLGGIGVLPVGLLMGKV